MEPISHFFYSHRLKLQFWDFGHEGKPTLILVHGGLDHARNWDWVARSLREHFHVYALEWHRDRLEFFVDGQKYFTYANEGTGRDVWPFDRDHYLILNLAIGGSWGGRQGIDADRFPQRLEIDYVRAYRETTSAGDAGVPGR